MKCSLQTILVVCFFSNVFAAHSTWSYHDQDNWPEKCMSGRYQSPINLDKDDVKRKEFHLFQFKNYHSKYPYTITNTGHSVAVKFKDFESAPSVRGAGFMHKYVLDHMHFHWESEHTINGNRYPLELHLVHYASKFNGTASAARAPDGLAVLGILFDISEDDNPVLEPILDYIEKISTNIDSPVNLPAGIVPAGFLPKDHETYFRYQGSLTTPGCNEAVVWTVFYHTVPISKAQVAKFPTIHSLEGPLIKNYRHLQAHNDRVVTFMGSVSKGVHHEDYSYDYNSYSYW